MLGLDFEGLRYQSSLNWVMRVFLHTNDSECISELKIKLPNKHKKTATKRKRFYVLSFQNLIIY